MKYVAYLLFGILLIPKLSSSQTFSAIRKPEGILIREGKKKVLFYQVKPSSFNGKYKRANYIHPLYGTDGAVLTEDFPEDHRHHRGIFWAWHQVLVGGKAMGDAWECRDFNWEVTRADALQSDTLMMLKTQVEWSSPSYTDAAGKPIIFMEEETSITIHPVLSQYRVIEFRILLRALQPDVSIGGSQDEKGYGGFSLRLKLPDDLQFRTQQGTVIPTVEPVMAGNWMQVSGSLGKGGRQAGVVIISDNGPPGEKVAWILRNKASMQNQAFPGSEPIPVPQESPLILNYRLLIYGGSLPSEAGKIISQ